MTTIFENTSISHTTTNGVNLSTGDTVYVASGVTIAGGVSGTLSNGLSSSGDGISAQILGSVWGYQYGIHFAGTSTEFNNILIGSSGSVIGVTKAGIDLASFADYINNAGLISGPTGIIMTGSNAHITNSGTITADVVSGGTAIDMTGSPGEDEIINTGLIDGQISLGTWLVDINNSGRIGEIDTITTIGARTTIQNSGTIGGTDTNTTGYAIWNTTGTGAFNIRNTGTIDGGIAATHSTGGSHIVVGAAGDIVKDTFSNGAVYLGGGNNTIIDNGGIEAYGVVPSGIRIDSNVGGNLVSIGGSGTVSAIENTASSTSTAIEIGGGHNVVTNHGSVIAYGGTAVGISLGSFDAGGHNTIVNSGTISADTAVTVNGGGNSIANNGTTDSIFILADTGADADSVVNTGKIRAGTADDAIDGSRSSVLSVTNTGHIVGNVEFGTGFATYDGSNGLVTGGTVIAGTGAAFFTGGDHADVFDVSNAAEDIVRAGAGNDTITVGINFAGVSNIDGGDGNDTVILSRAFSGPVTITSDMITNVETLQLSANNEFNLTTTDDLLAAGQVLRIDGYQLGSGDFTFDGSAETDGSFVVIGGGNDDVIRTGAGNDTINAGGGDDTIATGAGADKIVFGFAEFTANDKVDGGAGSDIVVLSGNYTGAYALTMNATTMLNVETLKLTDGNSYTIKTASATVASGQTLVVDGSALTTGHKLAFDGSNETNGHFKFISGGDSDTLAGGSVSDTFVYTSAAASTGTHYDTIKAFNFNQDKFDVAGTITKIDTATSHALSTASFDTDLSAAVSGHLDGHGAMLVTASSGTLNGAVFLVVDQNGTAGYQSGGDLVMHLTGAAGTLATSDFI